MVQPVDLKYGMTFGFVGFIITLVGMYYATGMLDPRFPAVIGAGFFGGGFIGSVLRGLYKGGEKRKANLILLAVILVVSVPAIVKHVYDILTGSLEIEKIVLISASAYLIWYGISRVKSEGVKE